MIKMITAHNQRRLKFFMDLGHPECGTAIEDCGPEYYCFEDVTNVQCQRQQNLARVLVFFFEVDTFVIVLLHAPLYIPASSALVADDMTILMCAMFSTAPLFGGMVVSLDKKKCPPALLCVLLGWECCQHAGDMLARQPNVNTFGRHAPVVATQNGSRHNIFVSVIADIHQIFSKNQSYILRNPHKYWYV